MKRVFISNNFDLKMLHDLDNIVAIKTVNKHSVINTSGLISCVTNKAMSDIYTTDLGIKIEVDAPKLELKEGDVMYVGYLNKDATMPQLVDWCKITILQ